MPAGIFASRGTVEKSKGFKLSKKHRVGTGTMLEKYLHMFAKLRTDKGVTVTRR
jgi:hypothetical protein